MQADDKERRDNQPTQLTLHEVENPLLVLSDFFNDDWLPEQMAQLERWRNFILIEEFYVDQKGNPGGLLSFYELSVRLVEAMWVLHVREGGIEVVGTSIVENEKATWRDYPVNLTDSELSDLKLATNSIYAAYNLSQYRELLHEWLEHGLHKQSAEGWINAGDIIRIYENLQKLYSVAWLIHQRSSDTPHLKTIAVFEQANNITIEQCSEVSLYRLNNVVPAIYNDLLREVVTLIVCKVPSVQCVIYLGVRPDHSDKIFLLVLTSDDEQRQAQHLNSIIEQSCEAVAKVTALVHYAGAFKTGVTKGNFFFCQALSCPVLYLSGGLLLPMLKTFMGAGKSANAAEQWERWFKQGKEFHAIAGMCINQGVANGALFLLHQSAECVLVAIIRAVLGYDINNHNLSRLLALTYMFTTDLHSVFDLKVEGDRELFEVLKHAYVNVRYRDNYDVGMETVVALQEKVQQLIALVGDIYGKHQLTIEL